jgi:hypothetical protein
MENLNPRISKVTVGIRELHTVSIYPLSFSDEMAMTDIIVNVIEKFMAANTSNQTDVVFVALLAQAIKDNIKDFIRLVTDPDEWSFCNNKDDMLKHVDNHQLMEIASIVKEANFGEDLRKKAISLVAALGQAVLVEPESLLGK